MRCKYNGNYDIPMIILLTSNRLLKTNTKKTIKTNLFRREYAERRSVGACGEAHLSEFIFTLFANIIRLAQLLFPSLIQLGDQLLRRLQLLDRVVIFRRIKRLRLDRRFFAF